MSDQAQEANQPEFMIQRVFVKDISLETPNSPQIFLEEWQPELNLDIAVNSNKLDDVTYESIITITVTVKNADKTAFLVEINQAGIFTMNGFDDEQTQQMLGIFCPQMLYPYAREAVTDLVAKAGFPSLYLQPVNFEALYLEQQKPVEGNA